jgi:hypothetical protein
VVHFLLEANPDSQAGCPIWLVLKMQSCPCIWHVTLYDVKCHWRYRLMKPKRLYVASHEGKIYFICPYIDMNMSYTWVLHIKVAYRVPHKWRHAVYVTRPLLCTRITCYVTVKTVEISKIRCFYHKAETLLFILGARGGAVGWDIALQAGRSRVWFPMVSLEFFIDINLPAALWPWGWLSPQQKWVP